MKYRVFLKHGAQNPAVEKAEFHSLSWFILASGLLLLFSPALHAAQPLSSPGAHTQVYLNISLVNSGLLRAHAVSFSEQVKSGNRAGGTGDQAAGDFQQLGANDVLDGTFNFTFDGQRLVDAKGKTVCDSVSSVSLADMHGQSSRLDPRFSTPSASGVLYAGDAVCEARYAYNPYTKAPVEFRNWYRPAMFAAEFKGSKSDSRIPPAVGVATFFPDNPGALNLYGLWGSLFARPAIISACLPLVIILALLVSSMMYMGKDPFSLYDITVPRLPATKRVRMKAPTIPYHLALKGRMSARIIRHHENVVRAQLIKFYKAAGLYSDRKNRAAIRDALNLAFNAHPITGGPKGTPDSRYRAAMARLKGLVNPDAKDNDPFAPLRRDAWQAITKSMELREVMLADLAATDIARSGTANETTFTKYMQRGVEFVGNALGSPLRLIPKVRNDPDSKLAKFVNSPFNPVKIPYAERTGLVIQNWMGSRSNSINLRRDIARTALAELGLKARLLKHTSPFARQNAFFAKKLADIPDIVATMRQELYLRGLAVSDEVIRKLVEAIYLNGQKDFNEIDFNAAMKANLALVAKLYVEAKTQALDEMKRLKLLKGDAGESDPKFNAWLARQYFIQKLIKHIETENILLRDVSGLELSAEQNAAFIAMARTSMATLKELIDQDRAAGGSILFGMFPDHSRSDSVNPEEANKRLRAMASLYDQFAEFGIDPSGKRIPIMLLGRDMADTFGLVVNDKRKGESIREEDRLAHIRFLMVGELARRKLFSYLISGKPLYDPSNPDTKNTLLTPLVKDKINEKWLDGVMGAINRSKLAEDMSFQLRQEWASRNYLTGYTSNYQSGGGLTYLSERNKIDYIRKTFALEFGVWFQGKDQLDYQRRFVGGSADMFTRPRATLDRIIFTYQSLRAVSEYYTGAKIDGPDGAQAMARWRARGVLGGDLQKGIWLATGDHVFLPLASNYTRDSRGLVKEAFAEFGHLDKDGKLVENKAGSLEYSPSAIASMLVSDYSERPINAALLYQKGGKSEGKWRPGSPTDYETIALANQIKSVTAELLKPHYGSLTSNEEESMRLQLHSLEGKLGEKLKLVTRTSLAGEPEYQNPLMRTWLGFSQLSERIKRGGSHNTDMRMHEWYTSQAAARVALFSYASWQKENMERLAAAPKKKSDGSVEVSATKRLMEATRWRAFLAGERNDLLKKKQVTSTELNALEQAYAANKGKPDAHKLKEAIDAIRKDCILTDLSPREAKKLEKKLGLGDFNNAIAHAGRFDGDKLNAYLRKEDFKNLNDKLNVRPEGASLNEGFFKGAAIRINNLDDLRSLLGRFDASARQAQKTGDADYSIKSLRNQSKDYQKDNEWADRRMANAAGMAVPFYNVAEQTVMRDPRVAFGVGQYGLGPAIMVGYPTGQFVGERPNMWAGYNLMPGDWTSKFTGKLSYMAAMGYGMATRTFFAKLSGYMSMYHLDPDKANSSSYHEPGIFAAIQSLFKPSQSFNWLTRAFVRPNVRGLGEYRDEFGGWRFKEESAWVGSRLVSPLSWKMGAGSTDKLGVVDDAYAADERKYKRMGLEVGTVNAQKSLGTTFRIDNNYLNQRNPSMNPEMVQENLSDMHRRLASARGEERTVLKSMIRDLESTYSIKRNAWKIPLVGKYFQDGFYNVSNLSGYDISAMGGAHRLEEMVWAYQQNIGKAFIPGMLFQDKAKDSSWELFPRISRSLDTSSYAWASNVKNRLAPDYAGGLGRDWRMDSTRDVYRKEAPMLTKFMDLEMMRQHFSFLNTPFAIPLSPFWIGGFHLLRHMPRHIGTEEHHIPLPPVGKWMRQQTWNTDAPRYYDPGKITEEEKNQAEAMKIKSDDALRETARLEKTGQPLSNEERSRFAEDLRKRKDSGEQFEYAHYNCPTHGILLQGGSLCPLCRSEEEYKRTLQQSGMWEKVFVKGWYNTVNHLKSVTPIAWADHHFNLASCPMHGIQYEKGTYCPMCASQKIRESVYEVESKDRNAIKEARRDMKEKIRDYKHEVNSLIGQMHLDLGRRESFKETFGFKAKRSDEEKGKIVADYMARREAINQQPQFSGINTQWDKRTRYREQKYFAAYESKRIKELEKEAGFKVKKE